METTDTPLAINSQLTLGRFQEDPEDAVTVVAAETFVIETAEDYASGWEVFNALAVLEKKIQDHYENTRVALNAVVSSFREMVRADLVPVQERRAKLGNALTAWKVEADRRDAERKRQEQEAADAAARAERDAAAAAAARLAETEPDPVVAESFRQEAAAIASTPATAAPVESAATAAPPKGRGSFRKEWVATVENPRKLMQAWLDDKCFFDEDALAEALAVLLTEQAKSLKANLSKAYPGASASEKQIPVAARRR